jgi:outer membrane protein assembly factor BamB
LAAYDLETGRRRWTGGTHRASYCSPVLATLADTRQILIHDEQGVAAHAVEDGRVLWHYPWTNSVVTNVLTPLAHAGGVDRVFLATGYGVGGALIHVTSDAAAGWKARQLWTTKSMKTKFCNAVLWEGHLYGLDDGILACVDVATGRKRWKDGRYGHGQLLLAGDLLLVQSESGDVVLIDPDPVRLRELGRIPALVGKTWNHPALAGPYLLVRNAEHAACFQLPLSEPTE